MGGGTASPPPHAAAGGVGELANKSVETVLTIKGLKKQFPGVRALDWGPDDCIHLRAGEIHALTGENGAGKSTLMHILSGIYQKDDGEITLGGAAYAPRTIAEANARGVAIILQEPGMVPSMSIGDNLFMGRERLYARAGLINSQARNRATAEALGVVGLDLSPDTMVRNLTYEQQKLVELARALSIKPRVLIVDETAAALSIKGQDVLFREMHRFKESGGIVLYISHRLEEVFLHCDRVSVMKDGRLVATLDTTDTNEQEVATLMVGREIGGGLFDHGRGGGFSKEVVLRVKSLGLKGRFHGVSFDVHRGEILGIGGLIGAGGIEVGRCIFGDMQPDEGAIEYLGTPIKLKSCAEAIALGMAYVPKYRDSEGLILRFTLKHNVTLPIVNRLVRGGFIDFHAEDSLVREYIRKLNIRCRGPQDAVINLSGGNRQKVVLAKGLASKARLLILNSPTRGVDVGAKKEIYDFIADLASEGMAIILISDELPELLGMSDTIIILRRGEISARISRDTNPTEEDLIQYML